MPKDKKDTKTEKISLGEGLAQLAEAQDAANLASAKRDYPEAFEDEPLLLIERPKITTASKIMKNSGFRRASEIEAPSYIPTGSWLFDNARGLEHAKGFRRGSTVVMYGQVGAGKSTKAYQMIGFWQSIGLQVALLNLEDSFDPTWATIQGVNVDKLYMTEVPEFADVAMQQALDALEGKYFDVLVTDSLHAVGTKREIDRKDTLEKEKPVAALAGKVTQFLRVAKPYMHSSKTVHLIIGHARINIDAGPMARGPQLMLTGGEHLQHESNDIYQVTKSMSKTRAPWVNDTLMGHAMGVLVEKTRGPGNRKRFDEIFITGKGFSEAWATIPKILADKDTALALLQQSGNFYTWTDASGKEQKVNGRFNLIEYFDTTDGEIQRLQKAYDARKKAKEIPESPESISIEIEE